MKYLKVLVVLLLLSSCITFNEGREYFTYSVDLETKKLYNSTKHLCIYELRNKLVNHPKGNIVYQLRMLEYEMDIDTVACPN
jgi:hypothetical protein